MIVSPVGQFRMIAHLAVADWSYHLTTHGATRRTTSFSVVQLLTTCTNSLHDLTTGGTINRTIYLLHLFTQGKPKQLTLVFIGALHTFHSVTNMYVQFKRNTIQSNCKNMTHIKTLQGLQGDWKTRYTKFAFERS